MLDWIWIGSPCEADWDGMEGDGKSRYCLRCEKMVYNLSAMTEAEAEATLCGSESSLPCVRFSRMSDGRVRTTDRRPLPRVVMTGGLLAAAAATAALTSQEDAGDWLWSRLGQAPMEQPGVLEVPEVAEGSIPEAGGEPVYQERRVQLETLHQPEQAEPQQTERIVAGGVMYRPPVTGRMAIPDRSKR